MRQVIVSILLLLGSCVDEPAPREAEATATEVEKDAAKDAVKVRQLSIEEAAEEAAKLIEAESKAEVDDMVADSSSN